MDIQPQSTQPISDDQELAKVLAGINSEVTTANTTPAMGAVEALVAPTTPPPAITTDPTTTAAASGPTAYSTSPVAPPIPTPIESSNELDAVKQEAITELRPLVDKLSLPAEEKFDTYLLLIRSTDDKSLIAPAHEAAKAIPSETRRAQALLDIIKEIDYLSNQPAA